MALPDLSSFVGSTVKVLPYQVTCMAKCPRCSGQGTVTCPRCDGKGVEIAALKVYTEKCPKCYGKGEIKCPLCGGRGT
jgi:DnaJ-class molecular chaperone